MEPPTFLLLLLLDELLLPQAAAPIASAPEAARASSLRDLTRSPWIVDSSGGTLSRRPPQSVIELWRRCENHVKAQRRSGTRSRRGCGRSATREASARAWCAACGRRRPPSDHRPAGGAPTRSSR